MHPVLHTIRAHNGVDYAAKRGSPVRTTGDGTVSFIGQRNGCGKEIVVNHSNEYSTRYCHLENFSKGLKKGNRVLQGETIGFVGSSGLATGPHLHYEFKIGNKRIDPIKVKLPSAEPVPKNLKGDFDRVYSFVSYLKFIVKMWTSSKTRTSYKANCFTLENSISFF
jgi:murein DD-endopeptidase MepM/ murein hydrolase activator NlpD